MTTLTEYTRRANAIEAGQVVSSNANPVRLSDADTTALPARAITFTEAMLRPYYEAGVSPADAVREIHDPSGDA